MASALCVQSVFGISYVSVCFAHIFSVFMNTLLSGRGENKEEIIDTKSFLRRRRAPNFVPTGLCLCLSGIRKCAALRRIQHIFNKNAIALCRVVDEHMGHGAD